MCGIGGIVRFDDQPIDPIRLRAMVAELRHRGPDGQGTAVEGRCGLVHTRLSIIDPARGQQPMTVPARGHQGPLTVVFNGEIYNHRDLRRRLESLGHQFKTDHCDTEVLLHGYRAWGDALPKHLEGMFAFAVWDARAGRLFLARDRAGKKPLFIRPTPSELIFGSEVATIVDGLPAGEDPQLCREAMAGFLALGYTGRRSMVEGVEEVPPAHSVSIRPDGETWRHYWQPGEPAAMPPAGDLIEITRATIAAAVSSRLEADAPLGCFLSGGIDSSLVAALAQAALVEQGAPPLKTFSVAMPKADYDESRHARAVALHLGTRHTELAAVPAASVLADLMLLTTASGEPTADSSILPTYWLSQATREHVAVALSGDGGDELFAGYDRYRAMHLLTRHRHWLRHLPYALLASGNPRSRRTRLRRLIAASRQKSPARQYRSMIQIFNARQLAALWPAGAESARADDDGLEGFPGWPEGTDPVRAAMAWDFENYLPFDLLRKVDRASMAVALEVRCPLLDRSVCALANALPPGVLAPGGKPKGLLRAVAAPLLPPAIVRRPKRGFAVPIGQWFRTTLRPMLREEILDTGLIDLGLNHAEIVRLEAEHASGRVDHTHRLFALLSLAVWNRWRRYRTRERLKMA